MTVEAGMMMPGAETDGTRGVAAGGGVTVDVADERGEGAEAGYW